MNLFFKIKDIITLFVFLSLLTVSFNGSSQVGIGKVDRGYNPRFWVDGIADEENKNGEFENGMPAIVAHAYTKGWGGILYWGAGHDGPKMNYYFNSAYLQKQPWAIAGKNNLTSLALAQNGSLGLGWAKY